MRFTRDMADAFGDWLERERIHSALLDARPELADSMQLDDQRPLLRITRRIGGGVVLVAKTQHGTATPWIVGVPGSPDPVLHTPDSVAGIIRTVLDALESETAQEERTRVRTPR